LLLPFVLLLSLSKDVLPLTYFTLYLTIDPETGHELKCTLCPAGTRAKAPCTRTQPTDCAPCRPGYYTKHRNFLDRCLPCRAPCDHNQRERQECTPTTDRVCGCAPGYYWRAEQCMRHTRCAPGFGAKRNGTEHQDTECTKCLHGTFSEGNSEHAQCISHTGCTSPQFKVLQGTSWHDDICASCTQLSNGGHTSLLRDHLPKFFVHENMKVRKLKKIVRFLGKQTQTRRLKLKDATSRQLIQYITDLTKAQDEELWKLPEMLESLQLHKTAKKLKKICTDLVNSSNCK
uniref:TNFR-Cys domain-containing protein n=1 Tax=Astyanax mexicanus TaxID=7994 RepID=A0A8B9LCX5_ASTMX